MAFPASTVLPADAYSIVKRAAVQLKLLLQSRVAELSAANTDYERIQDIYLTLKGANAQFDTLKTTPGLAQYARDQEGDQNLDITAAFTAMQSAIADALAWIAANVPSSVTVKPAAEWDGGVMISNTFTPSQTGGLRTELEAVIAEIS